MKKYMTDHVESHCGNMFQDSCDEVKQRLTQMLREVKSAMTEYVFRFIFSSQWTPFHGHISGVNTFGTLKPPSYSYPFYTKGLLTRRFHSKSDEVFMCMSRDYMEIVAGKRPSGEVMPKWERQMRAAVREAIKNREKRNLEADRAEKITTSRRPITLLLQRAKLVVA